MRSRDRLFEEAGTQVARAHRVGLVEDEALPQIVAGGRRREGKPEQEGDQGKDAPLEGRGRGPRVFRLPLAIPAADAEADLVGGRHGTEQADRDEPCGQVVEHGRDIAASRRPRPKGRGDAAKS